MMSRKYKVGAR